MTIVRRILPVLLAAVLLSACGETKDVLPEIEQEVKQEVETVLEEVEPTPEPTQTPEEAKTMASTASNATKDAPQVTDPSTWNDAGKTIMEALEKQYAPYGMTLQANEGTPYFLAVNRDANVVTVYTADEDGRYTVPFMAMVCSGGVDTPLGYYATPVDYDWRLLMGPSYGQYATRIFDSYLFHSVPYYSQHILPRGASEFGHPVCGAAVGRAVLENVVVLVFFIACQCFLKPVMLGGGVVEHHIQHQADTAFVGFTNQFVQIIHRAVAGIHRTVVGHIVAVVPLG